MDSRVFLVRHGETDWSKSGRHTSRTDISLNDEGERDARALGARLRAIAFSRILTSPRLRARRTCELAGLPRPAAVDPDLAEWDYGDYEKLRTSEILTERPGWNLFRDGCPGGESPDQVSDRADRLSARLGTLEGTVAAFSPRTLRTRPGRAVDRITGRRGAALPARHQLIERAGLRARFARGAGHRALEQRSLGSRPDAGEQRAAMAAIRSQRMYGREGRVLLEPGDDVRRRPFRKSPAEGLFMGLGRVHEEDAAGDAVDQPDQLFPRSGRVPRKSNGAAS